MEYDFFTGLTGFSELHQLPWEIQREAVPEITRTLITKGAATTGAESGRDAGLPIPGTCEDSFFKNADCSYKTVRVVGASALGLVGLFLVVRRFRG